MQTSESINDLAAALSKAQGAIEGAKKDSANPFFKSRYADLASVWDACRKPLADHGLSVVQAPSTQGEVVTVTTRLLHASGQWMQSEMSCAAKDDGPQSVGSAVTYLRRYALQSVVGIAPEDDDAEGATSRQPPSRVTDTTTGEDVSSDRAEAPRGFHYLHGYQKNGLWHEATLLRWDAKGGGLRVSTKLDSVGDVMEAAFRDGVPVRAEVTAKLNSPGQAYINKAARWAPAVPFDPPSVDITAADIPF